MKILKIIIIIVIALSGLIWLVSLNAGSKPEKFEYGVTFAPQQAEKLGLNWQEVYQAALSDLNFKHLRLAAYWNRVQPTKDQYSFEDLDFQMDLASKHNAKVVLGVGRKLPRWPECHEPSWAKNLSKRDFDKALFEYMELTVARYKDHPALVAWQVENEPFLEFGECDDYDSGLLDQQIALVKKIDPNHPIMITDSGEINFWFKAGSRGDIFGTTLYRYVFSDVFNRYWQNYIPYWFYRFKGGILKFLNPGKKIVIIELQAEPWTTRGILSTPVEEQFRTMSFEKFKNLQSIAKATGYSPQYFWGVEWWYWMKTTQSHPEFWEEIKVLNNN